MYNGKLVRLRPLEKSDLNEIMKFYNDYELKRLLGPPIVRSREYIAGWIEQVSQWTPWREGHLVMAIVQKETDDFLGIARIEDVLFPHSRAEIGISIYDPEQRGKGYGTDSTLVTLWIGFNILGLHSIYLDTMEDNERSIHVYEKIGFKRVGVLRETEFINGGHKGLLIMDILRDEFLEKYPPSSIIDSRFA
ncbi:MAG: N-acetyltransferase [Candidatus Thorarchaeota archaeon]|nr:N-acetyltransferase [Candidatus Thorarchaeota archaeon]